MSCDRHEEVIEALDGHEDRIRSLELADAETKTEIKNLIKRMEKLVETIEKLLSCAWKSLVCVAGIGAAFIIWYIQKG